MTPHQKWRAANPDKAKAATRAWARRKWATDADHRQRKIAAERERRTRNQLEAIAHYGGRCYCCGESAVEFLCLDHIHGGGSAHRRQLSRQRTGDWAKQQGFPEGVLRVACHNCNMASRLDPENMCPHQRKAESW